MKPTAARRRAAGRYGTGVALFRGVAGRPLIAAGLVSLV